MKSINFEVVFQKSEMKIFITPVFIMSNSRLFKFQKNDKRENEPVISRIQVKQLQLL